MRMQGRLEETGEKAGKRKDGAAMAASKSVGVDGGKGDSLEADIKRRGLFRGAPMREE